MVEIALVWARAVAGWGWKYLSSFFTLLRREYGFRLGKHPCCFVIR